MATCIELKKISQKRLEAAHVLVEAKDFDTSMYLMGYSVECALKAAVCDTLNLDDYPDKSGFGPLIKTFMTHDLESLLILSGLSKEFSINTAPKRLFENWSLVSKTWDPAIRYLPVGSKTEQETQRMLNALIEDPNGVLQFIWKHMQW